jgi:hypothetical protein
MIRKLALAAVSAAAAAAVAFLLVFSSATARDPAPALWKIDGPNGDIYFFGSIHILPKGYQWRRSELDAALQQAARLVFEIDFDKAKDPTANIGLVTQYGFLPPDKSLRKMLAPEYRKKLDEASASLGLPPAGVDRMRPWLAALTLTSLNLIKQNTPEGQPIDPNAATAALAGVDVQLWDWAKTANKERAALETTEDQIRIFADLPEDQQVQLLVVTLKEVNTPREWLDGLLDAWKTGDVAKLDKFINGDMATFPTLNKAVFHDRHVKWLPQIERMMADGGNHVIVVGTGHLVGKDSIIAMLRTKGVKIEGP